MLRAILLLICCLCTMTAVSAARNCTEADYVFEYTECKTDGSRWRVSVPKENGACLGGEPPAPPIKGQPCDFTCGPGTYLQKEGDQECHLCPPGEYSLGGGVRYDDWDVVPEEFSQKTVRSFDFAVEGLNCNGTKWVPWGDYIEAMGKDCAAQLILNVQLITKGKMAVVYQYPASASMFKILRSSDQCVSNNDLFHQLSNQDDNFETTYLTDGNSLDDETWRTEEISLSSGKNQIIFQVDFYGMIYGNDINDRMVKIKSIEINGVAYSSSCAPCPPGTHSSDEGASKCDVCPKDTHAPTKRSSKCLPCNSTTHYAPAGSVNCTRRKPCTKQDYFSTHTPCDEKGQTRMMYKWVEPRVCRFDVKGSVSLPSSEQATVCPPCNPGMTSVNVSDGSCVFCPKGYHGSGAEECKKCPPETEPSYNIEMKYFHSLPSNAQIECFSAKLLWRGCSGVTGWIMHGDYIGTEPENDVSAKATLTIQTIGFRGQEGIVHGQPNSVGRVQFVFEMICDHDCELSFLETTDIGMSQSIKTWTKQQEKKSFAYDVTHSGKTQFMWRFKKSATYDEFGETGDSSSATAGELRIYSINITNTKDGGASVCSNCLTKNAESKGSECLGCSAGKYYDPETKDCFFCPENTYANVLNSVGQDSCIPCGPGTKSVAGSTFCYSDCTFTDTQGRFYNFSALVDMAVNVSSAPLFTLSGSQYFHQYTIDICGKRKNATCNATVASRVLHKENVPNVRSSACKISYVPNFNGSRFFVDPVSIGDQLLAVVDKESLGNLTRNDFTHPDERNGTVITFFYRGSRATSACPSGRSAVVSLHCNPDEKGPGKLTLPQNCPDGTCDGCVYGFIWHTQLACPFCRKDDYESFKDCNAKDNMTHIVYRKKDSSVCYRGLPKPADKKIGGCVQKVIVNKGSILDYKVYIAIGLGVFVLLMIFLFVLWYKNRSLEYKYQKLIQSSNPGDELPAPETCGQDSEEEIVFDQKRPGRGKKLLKKIKNLAGKKDEEEEYFDTIKLEPMATST
ncbi:endosome/lysosome-associated apoptosis and autophagy regulator family member 2-like isoform X2 [Oscarella lobularis]|uniref:endosome/lysosome-associated apoptosis and autophagy regulator family member 2-like isoform X2 n=1 Tax=Oscarella lobularis TaxID=121494 RepID=UPI003313D644